MVHVSTMAGDYYRFVDGAHLLRGREVYRLGDKVSAGGARQRRLRRVDLGLVEILERVREGAHGPRRSRAAPKHESRRKQRPGRRERDKLRGKKRR
jgi:hypothetical protein